jgi:hypothetical protein
MEELLSLRAENLPFHQPSAIRASHDGLDASLKKIQSFRTKLRSFPDHPIAYFRDEIATGLNLSKYLAECASALLDAKFKPNELVQGIKIASFLHQNYAEFSAELAAQWSRRIATTVNAADAAATASVAGTSSASAEAPFECCVTEGDVLRKRALFRMYVDLLSSGVVAPEKPLFMALRQELVLNAHVEIVAPLAAGFAKYFFKLEPNPFRGELVSAIHQLVTVQFAQQRFVSYIVSQIPSMRELAAQSRSSWFSRGEIVSEYQAQWTSWKEKLDKWMGFLAAMVPVSSLDSRLLPFYSAFVDQQPQNDELVMLMTGRYVELYTAAGTQTSALMNASKKADGVEEDNDASPEEGEEDFPTWLQSEDDNRLFYVGVCTAHPADTELDSSEPAAGEISTAATDESTAEAASTSEEPHTAPPTSTALPSSTAADEKKKDRAKEKEKEKEKKFKENRGKDKVKSGMTVDEACDAIGSSVSRQRVDELCLLLSKRSPGSDSPQFSTWAGGVRRKLLQRIVSSPSMRIECIPYAVRALFRLDFLDVCPDLLSSVITAATSLVATENTKQHRGVRILSECFKCCLYAHIVQYVSFGSIVSKYHGGMDLLTAYFMVFVFSIAMSRNTMSECWVRLCWTALPLWWKSGR